MLRPSRTPQFICPEVLEGPFAVSRPGSDREDRGSFNAGGVSHSFLLGQASLAKCGQPNALKSQAFWRVFGQGADQAAQTLVRRARGSGALVQCAGKVLSYVAVESTWLKHPRHLHAHNPKVVSSNLPPQPMAADQRPPLRRPFFLALRIGIFCRVQFVQTATVRGRGRDAS